MKPPAAALQELKELLTLGVSLVVATRDDGLVPAIVRCGGARLGDDGWVRVAIPLPEGARTVANLEANGAISLTASQPTTYRTLQVKGRRAQRVPWPELSEVTARHRAALVAEVARVGIDAERARRTWSHRFVAVGFEPEELFDQSPGPLAGLARLS